ncbi:peptide deformylase [Longirhabdus pacifica]|uniref:peptide deformylase n=1 Tax=Longirhabdus pacifica TaxID=2305227 RepID=UPI0010089EA5|nr:peptide deformylase [Longirhabdus pacifica]
MGIRIIVKDPDPILKKVCKPVTKFNANLHKLLDDMAATMYDAPGVGLAAPQIGILKRVFVMDAGDENGLIELINPEIVEKEGEQLSQEGCLSIPGFFGDVRRFKTIKVKAQDRNGETFFMDAEDYVATIYQHEMDHLNGVLYTDIAEKVFREKESNNE